VVTTVGGQPGVIGTKNGTNTAALFNLMEGVFVDPWGNLYVADTQNDTIRIGYAGPPVILNPPTNTTVAVGGSASFTVTAAAAAPSAAYQWRFNGVSLTNNAHVSGAQSNVLTLTAVSNSNAGTYQVIVTNAAGSTNVSATLTVSLIAPVLTWTNPAAIRYATALSSTQLDATANVPGSFVYNPAAGTVLNAGTTNLRTVFTPTDTGVYSSATSTVSLVVLPAPLTVTVSNASRLYGQANPLFQGSLVGLQNGDNITATYTTTATSNSPVGTYPIAAGLTDPNGKLANYTVTTNNGLLTVNKATPVITTGPSATAIIYGQSLTNSTLSGGAASVPGAFAFTMPSTVPPVGTALQSVTFTPTDMTNYNTAQTNVNVTVAQASPQLTWTNPAAIYYGTAIGSTQLNATADVPGSFAYAPAAGTVLNAGTNTLGTVFTPTDTADYLSATSTVSLLVLPAPLAVTVSNASRLYGQANPVFQGSLVGLQNGDNITAAYTTTATSNSPVGTYPITAGLNDPNGKLANYTVTTNNGLLTVNKATPVITTGPNATAIIYGQSLTNSTLSDGAASVPGAFAFTTPSTMPPVGTALQSVTFTTADTTNYNTAQTNVNVTVAQASPQLTWTNPAAIYYGTAIGSTQLNATADVPGSFAYAPAAGTVLNAGTNTLGTVFTPTDTADYLSATSTVSLVVLPAPLTVTASNASKVYGQLKTFAGTEFTSSGLEGTDTVTQVSLTSAGAPAAAAVGHYPIVASAALGTGLSNYVINYVDGDLTVFPPTLVTIATPVVLSNGTIQLTFSGGDAGVSYRIQASSNLNLSGWNDLGTNLAGTNGLPVFLDLDATNWSVRFYRTVTP
jgi:hypothetical protein